MLGCRSRIISPFYLINLQHVFIACDWSYSSGFLIYFSVGLKCEIIISIHVHFTFFWFSHSFFAIFAYYLLFICTCTLADKEGIFLKFVLIWEVFCVDYCPSMFDSLLFIPMCTTLLSWNNFLFCSELLIFANLLLSDEFFYFNLCVFSKMFFFLNKKFTYLFFCCMWYKIYWSCGVLLLCCQHDCQRSWFIWWSAGITGTVFCSKPLWSQGLDFSLMLFIQRGQSCLFSMFLSYLWSD